ncbi:efflux RND transporter periplasmic adaptor subunit [Aliiglaciecola sp. LCG003]|uniref:efflux RND transporter periplasmic adaptor subunit n=1 Tax=Aliiglaciecola sp. LCG003 TaxID=3053655 RepID=UPI00257273B4|nr:efflux RND transporter periplasmic adaptor subunit [Aliiglaciecola sp. LCG003]WJG09910.1 efflux RND transporter periplasmic adaptor subunit [Aliiglaciecola sp. LCG003]
MNLLKLITAASAICILFACNEPPLAVDKKAGSGVEQLETVSAEQRTINIEVQFDGIVEAVNRSTVSAQTSGRIVELPFDVGDFVAQGEVIARLTDSEQQAALVNANAQLNDAQARFTEADQQLSRINDVFSRGAVSKADLDRAKAAQNSAAARVQSAKAAITDAQQRLSYTKVVAPYSGILVRRLADVGSTVAPGSPLMEGVSLSHLRVQVDVPQNYIGSLRQHKQARVILPDGQSIEAASLRIPPSADTASHSFKSLVELPQAEREPPLFPGTLVKVAFATGSEESVTLPDVAVAKRGEVNGVYVLDANQMLEFRYVRLGKLLAGDHRVVEAGIEQGTLVALDPVAAASVYKSQHFNHQN